MGFSGQLSSVNLADIFQTLHMNRQTGTLTVAGPTESVRIWFDQGNVAIVGAPAIEHRPYLFHHLAKKGVLTLEVADDLLRRQRQSGQNLRELILVSGFAGEGDLDEVVAWCIEERVCPTFEWTQGEFGFEEGDPGPDLLTTDVLETGANRMPTTALVMEATRRKDEWRRIREVITDPDALYVVDNDGRNNLRSIQTDPEMLKVLRYLDGRHTLEAIATAVGATRFDTYAIVAQLVLAGVTRARSPAEIVEDAVALKNGGEPAKARDLLENAARQAHVPEVLEPLAEVCAQLNQVPRAVELYLILIQQAQDAGDLARALACLDTVIGLSPDDPDLQFERAQVHAELGNVEPAAQGYVTAAQAYLGTKDVAKAIDACHRAKNLLPRSPDPHRYLARAYLLDGNTETAVVEYKALWHALLTQHRPRKALEELQTILDADCKYAAVKDQVLAHARNSEAVKTSRAVRWLVYVAMAAVLAVAAFLGWRYYDSYIVIEDGRRQLAELERIQGERCELLEHPAILAELSELRRTHGIKSVELDGRIGELESRIRDDFERRASTRLAQAEAHHQGGQYAKAYATLDEIVTRFTGTRAALGAEVARARIRSTEIGSEVLTRVQEARRRWTTQAWDEALAELAPVAARADLPADLRKELTTTLLDWQTALKSARRLGERADAIERTGDLPAALVAWRRAAAGEGDADRVAAQQRLVALERTLAAELARKAQTAAARGDAVEAFAALDQATVLAREAAGPGPKEVLGQLTLPFTIEVDSRHVLLAVARAGGQAQVVRAPAGTTGVWRHTVTWRPSETVAITASRTGFTAQTLTISVAARRVATQIQLVRGPRWRVDLGAQPTAVPVAGTGAILVGTNRSTLEVIDPQQGVSRAVAFPDSVAELSAPPVLHQNRAYTVLDDRIHAIDAGARARLWSWPSEARPGRTRLGGALAVAEHELIQGQLLVFAAAAKGGLVVLAADGAGQVQTYPAPRIDAEVTGQLVVERSDAGQILYVPAGPALMAFELASFTGRGVPEPIFTARTRGDLTGVPRAVRIGGMDALLCTDSSGLVVAIARMPGVPEAKRIVGSWAVDGSAPSAPALASDGNMAYVALAEGRVQALGLSQPGQTLWRAPLRGGSLGPLVGAPAVGRRGIYVVDGNGLLHCLDAKSGELRWRADLGGAAIGGCIALDGRVLIAVRSGQLVCFEEGED